jgi:hypothetical protein
MMLLLLAAVTIATLQVQPREQRSEAGLAVINTEADWSRFTEDAAPGVDFRKHTVVAVFAGEKPTAGYSVRITKVEKEGDTCVVHHVVSGPPRDAMVAQVITYPYIVVRLDEKCTTVKLR